MDPLDEPTARLTPEHYGLGKRLLRAMARRFPRLHIALNLLRAKVIHYARLGAGRLRYRRLAATCEWITTLAAGLIALRREKRITVAVDVAAFWEPLTGIGWYLHRILEQLAGRDDVRLRLYGPSIVTSPDLPTEVVRLPTGPALERMVLDVPDDLLLPRGLMLALLRRLEPWLIAAHGNRVLFAPNYFLPRRFLAAGGARVATIHDLGWRKVPWTLRRETLSELSERLEHGLFEATRLITVSETVRDELVELGLAAPGRVRAIHHGPGQLAGVAPGPLPSEIPRRYALHVGTLEPRKNILGLLDAWRRLRALLPDPPALVLCGRYGWKAGPIRAAVEEARIAGWLVHPGYVSEGELAALYNHAEMVVFPSLYEGFGLPAIEAQQAGAPLVCSDIAVLREVAGEGALFTPPGDPDALAAAIVRLLGDSELRQRLVTEGRRRAARLSWSRSALMTLELLTEAAGGAPSHGPEGVRE